MRTAYRISVIDTRRDHDIVALNDTARPFAVVSFKIIDGVTHFYKCHSRYANKASANHRRNVITQDWQDRGTVVHTR